MTGQTPRTAAGRRAEMRLAHFEGCAGLKGPNDCDCGVTANILAIEAEARAEALDVERIRLALRYIHGDIVPLPNRPTVDEYADIIVSSDRAILAGETE